MTEANVAVLIDYENVGLDAIQYLLDQLSDVGRVIIKRAYGDWSVQRGKQDQLLELGIEPIHQYLSNRSGKNSSDIRLAIEAIDLLFSSPIDTFVIVSSDSDFVPLVGKLRSSGKTVIGAGRRDATSNTLITSCDRYVFLDDAKPAAPAVSRRKRRRPSKGDAQSVVARAMEVSMDEEGKVVGSKLYQTMCRIDPSFDYKAFGYRNFTQFLDADPEVNVVRPQSGGGDVIVQLKQSRDKSGGSTNGAVLSEDWDKEIDSAWANRGRRRISGRAAAADAAKVLEVPKLSASRFPSLAKLLAASKLLQSHWRREGNAIIKI